MQPRLLVFFVTLTIKSLSAVFEKVKHLLCVLLNSGCVVFIFLVLLFRYETLSVKGTICKMEKR